MKPYPSVLWILLSLTQRKCWFFALFLAIAPLAHSQIVLTLGNATASYEQSYGGSYLAAYSIDDDARSGWAVYPNTHNPNWIEWSVADAVPGNYTFLASFNFGTHHVLENYTLKWTNDQTSWHAITSFGSTSDNVLSVDSLTGMITTQESLTAVHVFAVDLATITGIRLEAPANASFRDFGSGEYLNENFVLTDFKVSVTAIPEPSTYAAILGGLALLGLGYRRFRKAD